MSRPVQVKVGDGGALLTSLSLENIGEANYARKVNLRRDLDQERRREGWTLFKPNGAGADSQSVYDGTETLLRIAELIRPNGDRVVVAASRTLIKRFNTTSGLWETIGSGFSAQGARWQAVTMNGYLMLNNTVDLIVAFRVEWSAVMPVYELREVGIGTVGTMTENNGFLVLANIGEIQNDQLDAWMAGYANYAASTPVAQSANFTALNSDSGTQFNITTGSANVVLTLPTAPTNNFYLWLQKADISSGTVTTLPVLNNQVVTLVNQHDKALLWYDPVLQKYTAKVFPLGVIPAFTPYGAVPADILNKIPWEVINGEFGQPTNWAPSFPIVLTGSTATITLPFQSHAFIAGQTRVAVLNGGPSGGTLGGDTLHPDGILITAINGSIITLEIPTDNGITYPRTVNVTRWTDVSTLVTKYQLQGDGSAIITCKTLQNLIIVYRETGVYVGRYTGLANDALGNVTGPYTFRERYKGANVPLWGDAVVSVRDDYHVYPSQGQRFYQFDGSYQPELHQQLDQARISFFGTTPFNPTEEIWATANPITSEVWFVRPGVNTIAFDYVGKTVGEIDVGFDAAAYIHRPGNSLDHWFILGIGHTVSTYGLVAGQQPFQTWLRNGAPVTWDILSGLSSLTAQQRPGYPTITDEFNEKDVMSYTPVFASSSPDYAMTVQILSTYNPAVLAVPLLNPVQALPDPNGANLIMLFYRGIYFQVGLHGTDTRDIDFCFSSHLWEVDRIAAGGINRRPDV